MNAARGDAIRWTGIGLILAGASIRALSTLVELPGWDLDPSMIAAPLGGIGPAASLWLDAVLLLGAGLTLLGDGLLGRRPVWWMLALALAGCIPVVYHGWLAAGVSLEQARIGSTWAASVLAAVALAHACRDPGPRRAGAGVLLGIIAVLALKGAHQILIEHPRTLADYGANREVFLAAQGWSPDSPMARAYERRLGQREANGWFGLANVYATFAAAAAVALGALAAGLLRPPARGRLAAGIGALALTAAAALLMSGAKGGLIAAAAGAGATAALAISRLAARIPRRATLAALIAVAAVAGPITLVVIRGQLGEDALGADRSLLFRWFYFQAAARITAEHPLTGVGPAGFQEAYLLAKNPLSTEDVRSPHSLLLDWVSTLGLAGLAWAALFLAWLVSAAVRAVREGQVPAGAAPSALSPTDARTELRVALLACAGATIAAAWFDRGHTTPDAALVRVAGLAAWSLAAWAILRAGGIGWPDAPRRDGIGRLDAPRRDGIGRLDAPRRDHRAAVDSLALALAGAAITAAAHGQIDVAGSWPQSAPLFLALIGVCGAPAARPAAPGPLRPMSLVPGVLAGVLAVLLALAGALPAQRWERDLLAAADHARILGEANEVLGRANSTDAIAAGRARAELLSLLSSALGRRVEASGPAVEAALGQLEVAASTSAADLLTAAAERDPSDWRPRREASRMLARAGAALARSGRAAESRAAFDRAVAVLGGPADPARSENRPATQLAWLAVIYRTRHEALGGDPADLRGMAGALGAAAARDPTNPDHAARLALALRDLHEPAAPAWARRALELDALGRLDPLARSLGEDQRRALRALAGEP